MIFGIIIRFRIVIDVILILCVIFRSHGNVQWEMLLVSITFPV